MQDNIMNIFKKSFAAVAVMTSATAAFAQPTLQAQHPLEHAFENHDTRTEIILPQVDGMNFYKADLHIHTIYSDGDVTPDMRVLEAWHDGLDIIAITDHMEYRRIEREMLQYMDRYVREDFREKGPVNTNIMRQGPDSVGVLVDFNVAYMSAAHKAKDYGLLVVRGVEVTRKHNGDYNALFTTDNNAIYDPSLEQTLRNARSQGAFIVHNHPDYDANTSNHITQVANGLYEKGLIDGVEVANGRKTWAYLYTHAVSGGYTPMANSDAHEYIYWKYGRPGDYEIPRYRNMNLILADSLTENDIHEALKAGNTIAYSNNNLIGKADLLEALFEASIEFRIQRTSSTQHHVIAVNHSSLPYYFKIGNTEHILNAMGSLHFTLNKDMQSVEVTVLNMWYGNDEHPVVSFELK